jgi:hypothetical protein
VKIRDLGFWWGVVGVKRDAADRVAVVGQKSINTKDSPGFGGHFRANLVGNGWVLAEIRVVWWNVEFWEFCYFLNFFFLVGVVGVKWNAADRVAVVGQKSIKSVCSPGAGGHFGANLV